MNLYVYLYLSQIPHYPHTTPILNTYLLYIPAPHICHIPLLYTYPPPPHTNPTSLPHTPPLHLPPPSPHTNRTSLPHTPPLHLALLLPIPAPTSLIHTPPILSPFTMTTLIHTCPHSFTTDNYAPSSIQPPSTTYIHLPLPPHIYISPLLHIYTSPPSTTYIHLPPPPHNSIPSSSSGYSTFLHRPTYLLCTSG